MYKKRFRVDVSRSISSPFLKMFKYERKGQLTLFIVLGILLLLALILVIFLKKEIVTFKPEGIIPTEKGKVESYITNCIQEAGEEALFKVGIQGGYIEVPAEISDNGNLHLRTSPFTVVPYWAYGLNTNIPSLEQIKAEIDDYMEEQVRECLFGLDTFQQTYDLIEKSKIESNTEIVESKVIFNLHWIIEIRNKDGDVITEVINHVAESPIKLKKVYETARKIVEKEMETMKFEDITQDLIALEHPNVPVAGMEMSCGEKKWKISTVKDTLKSMLRVNLRELRVQGTDYIEFPADQPYYQNHYIFNVGDDFVNPQVSVIFTFEDNYPFAFDVIPRSGMYMKSNQMGGTNELLDFFCVQAWKFVYDVTYPVLVTVRDETTGYSFKNAFTVHLKGNIPDRSDVAVEKKPFVYDTITDEEFCQGANIPMTVITNKLVEDETSGVYDKEPLEDVALSFTCLKYQCPSGRTEYDFAGRGDIAAYSTNFPYCVGGIMRGQKEGYKDGWVRIVTSPGAEVEIDLAPVLIFPVNKIKVVKHELLDEANSELASARELNKEEVAFIKMIYMKDGQPFQEVSTVLSPKFDPKIVEGENIELLAEADFTYALEVNILEGDKFVGGYKGNWTISWEELQTGREIIFHILSKEKVSEEEMFELMFNLEKNSAIVPAPEIK